MGIHSSTWCYHGFTTIRSRLSLPFQGKDAEAEQLYERSQAIRETALGSDHPDVAQVLNYRAGLLERRVRTVIECQ